MTQSHNPCGMLITGLSLLNLASSAYAQQPPDIVQSDSTGNTAMGTGALALNQNTGLLAPNTASGFDALFSNTTGFANTASGASSLFSNKNGAYNSAFGWEA